MTYSFIFEDDYSRLIMATIIDARASIPQIKNKIGFVIKDYVDSQVALITDNTIVYKIESNLGNLAGYFSIVVNTSNKTAILQQLVLRPAFQTFSEINTQITNFIMSNSWHSDYLFD